MTLDLRRGQKLKKGELLSQMYRMRFHRKNSTQLFAALSKAGYINVNGKVVYVRKNLRLG